MPSRGELEQRILEVLWSTDAALSVADVHAVLNEERQLAYTTVMTVLDRLAKKGLVTRELVARAWRYRPGASHAELLAEDLAATLEGVDLSTRREALTRFSAGLSSDELIALRG